MSVETKIKQYIEENSISQKWLSEATSIPPSRLSLTLNGHRRMTFSEYELICGALGVSVTQFLSPRVPKGMIAS